MSEVTRLAPKHCAPPASYVRYIDRAIGFVQSKGLAWEIPYDPRGEPIASQDWDLRVLGDSHDRYASRLGSFAVDTLTREVALAQGWSLASMPQQVVLEHHVQCFTKAAVASCCEEKKNLRTARHFGRNIKLFFSVTSKHPWQVSTEDIQRYLELWGGNRIVHRDMRKMSAVLNENFLSIACPVVVPRVSAEHWRQMHESLLERASAEKLPDDDALYELARIVLKESPQSHVDLLRFCVVRVVLFTGLRLAEVLSLPADCLKWEEHVDVVTGRPGGEVGGVSRSLTLRYFAAKDEETRSDILVEDFYPVPELFQNIVASAVEGVKAATGVLRELLAKQFHQRNPPKHSDLRRFKTTSGASLTTADFLLLRVPNKMVLPPEITVDTAISTLTANAMYAAMGTSAGRQSSSLFSRYGSGEVSSYVVWPHSLRHLLNTELFRLGVPDTVITQQFGRTTVAQSYEYDHRTLSEKLAFIRLPETVLGIVHPGTSQEVVAKLVVGNLIPHSRISMTFEEIQGRSGDRAAFEYLVAATDGFHVTPYGFCLTSFSMSPCPKHLKCFHGCKHFAASGLKEHRISLETLRDQLIQMRQTAVAKPATTLGRKNQIAHANSLIEGVQTALETQPNMPVFPDGQDFSMSPKDIFS